MNEKPIKCDNCDSLLGFRRDNTLIVGLIELELKETHNIKCERCQCHTKFAIDTQNKRVKV